MKLTLCRMTLTPDSTAGTLYIDGVRFCYTLELPVVDGMPGSAIPEGTYPVVLAPSAKFMHSIDMWVLKFAQLIPHIIQIPDRTDILVHWGNTAEDTKGCVLVGTDFGTNYIGNSRLAFEKLWQRIQGPARSNDCTITIQRGSIQPADLSLQGDA